MRWGELRVLQLNASQCFMDLGRGVEGMMMSVRQVGSRWVGGVYIMLYRGEGTRGRGIFTFTRDMQCVVLCFAGRGLGACMAAFCLLGQMSLQG